MKANVFFYCSKETRQKMYHDLNVFGARVFYEAKIIKEIDLLEQITDDLDNGVCNPLVKDFMFNYLIDAVRIIIFFENHMKALLIWKGYCVNKVNGRKEFKELAKKQYKEPIFLGDIPSDPKEEINLEKEEIFHPAFKETTIGMRELMEENYLEKYSFDNDIIEVVKELVIYRNKLHFHHKGEFSISKDKIMKLKKIISYVEKDLGFINTQ